MKNKNAIKVAYIIFLIICAIYHIVSDVFNLNFENWERIVCAATIASYFFSGASARKTVLSITEKLKVSLENSNRELINIKKERELFPEKYSDSKYDIQFLEDTIEKNKKALIKLTKEDYWVFTFNTLGFLSFFCIHTFNGVYQCFANSQEFFTLVAFILILVAEAYEERFNDKYSWIFENPLNQNIEEE